MKMSQSIILFCTTALMLSSALLLCGEKNCGGCCSSNRKKAKTAEPVAEVSAAPSKGPASAKKYETGKVHAAASFQELEDILASNDAVIVDFYAPWCGPCKQLAPKFEDLSKKNPNVLFVKIDADAHSAAASKYKIHGFPTLIGFRNGSEKQRVVGGNLDAVKTLVASL